MGNSNARLLHSNTVFFFRGRGGGGGQGRIWVWFGHLPKWLTVWRAQEREKGHLEHAQKQGLFHLMRMCVSKSSFLPP